MILQSLAGLPAFMVYFRTALVAVVAYLFVYTRVTPDRPRAATSSAAIHQAIPRQVRHPIPAQAV